MERETAMKILKELHDNSLFSNRIALETLIPELADSNDERIRKALLEMVHDTTGDELWVDYNVHKEEALAWLEKQGYTKKDIDNAYLKGICDAKHELEKQGEQKPILDFKASNFYVSKVDGKIHDMTYNPTNKIEPKFHVGDWILYSGDHYEGVRHITKIDENGYYIERNGLPHGIIPFDHEICMRLWTIQDAKDGDVLACGDKVTDCPFIYHNLTEELNPRSYCGINMLQHFQDNDENGGYWCSSAVVRPATKEQRDLLFAKMKEAGYEWDAEKKELKKIEQRISDNIPQAFEKYVEHLLSLSDGEGHGSPAKVKEVSTELFKLAKLKQKPAWSGEDEEMAEDLIKGCVSAEKAHYFLHTPKVVADWLKSIKERIKGKED